VLQSAQDPEYRHYTYDPIVRSTAALERSEEIRRAAAAEADDEAGDSRPILEQCVKQTAMVANMVAAFTDETVAIAESLQCAPLDGALGLGKKLVILPWWRRTQHFLSL
jgi:hypothetical protein